MLLIQRRLPPRDEILQVLGTCMFAVFGWSLRGFFYNLPSFVLSQRLGTIFGIFAYMMTFALLESFLFVGALLLGSIFLPGKWYRDGFAYKGLLTILVISVASTKIQRFLSNEWPAREVLLPKFAIALLVLVLLIVLAHFVLPLQKLLLNVAERMQVFLYLYGLIGIIGILTVIIRNLQ